MSRRYLHSALAAAVCALLLSITIVGVLGAPTRPAIVKFGFLHNTVDSFFTHDAVQLYAGLKAAEKEINDADLLHGTALQIQLYPAPSYTASAAVQAGNAFAAAADGIMGFVAADWVSSAYAYAASGGALPVVASRSLSETEFSDPSKAFVNSYRPPVTVQYRTMLKHAFIGETGHYTHFAVLTRGFFPSMIAKVRATLARFGYPEPVHIDMGANPLVLNVTDVLEKWLHTSPISPLCGLFFGTGADVTSILGAMYSDPRFVFGAMSFYAADLAFQQFTNHSVHGTAPFERLYFARSYPDEHSDLPVARSYRAALAAWLGTNPTLPAALLATNVSIDVAPNPIGMEGYFAGRFVGSVLKYLPSLTPQSWTEAVYGRSYFWIDDTLMGPFVNRTLNNPDLTMPSFCNVGAQTTYIYVVNTTTARVDIPPVDAIGYQALQLTTSATNCVASDSDITFPIHFQLYAPSVLSAAGQATFDAFYSFLRLRGQQINDAGYLQKMQISVAYMNKIIIFVPNETPHDTLQRLYTRRRPFIILGNWWTTPDVEVDVLNVNLSPNTLLEDPPLTAATRFTRNTWYLKPTLADQAHTLAMLLAREYAGRGAPTVRVCASAAVPLELAVKSLHTAQLAVEPAALVDLADAAVVRRLFDDAMATAATGRESVLFFSSLDAANVVRIVNVAVAATAAVEATASASTVFAHLRVAIATDQGYLYTAKYQLGNVSALLRFPIYFSSYLYPHFEATNSQRQAVGELLNTTAPAVLESMANHAGAVISELFANALSKIIDGRPSPSAVLDIIYAQGTSNANGVLFGPFQTSNCTADVIAANRVDRTCQCFKALRTFNAYDFRGWLTNDAAYNPHFAFSQATCGPQYEALRVASQLNVAMIAGIAAPCGAVFVAGVLYFMCCFGRRSNRSAPKDPNAPFAMVFTDIQSSTSLWARAPEFMGDALEQHHAMLRKLLAAHDGYEVKTIGDSFMVAFKRAADAAAFALEIQTALFAASWAPEIDDVYIALAQEAWEEKVGANGSSSGGPLTPLTPQTPFANDFGSRAPYSQAWNGIRVRVGLHWGVGSVKQDPVSQGYDYYGTLVNTAARVEGVGNGGQVLATKDLFDQLEAEGFDFAAVDVRPLGPQPLRGLDQPVPLYQLCPVSLATRQFNALRLDVEVDPEDATSDATTGPLGDGTATHTSAADDTPEMHLERLLRRQKDAVALTDHLQRVAVFLQTALRMSPMSWRKDTVKALLKKWHVKPRQPPADKKEPAEKTLQYDIAALTVRVGLAAEEARRAAASATRGVAWLGSEKASSRGTGAHSRISGNGGDRVVELRRLSSIRRRSAGGAE